jgi:uncharacterized membrane protein
MNFSRYTLTDIGTLTGLPFSHASAINTLPGRTQVIGWSAIDADDRSATAFLWEKPDNLPAEPLYDIRDYTGPQILASKALGLNSIFPSTVVGWLSQDGTTRMPMEWTRLGFKTIPTFPGATQAGEARSVDNRNVIVGYALTAQGKNHACVKLPTSGMLDLGTRSGDQGESEAYYINNNGVVVGLTQIADPPPAVGTRKTCAWLLGKHYQDAANAPIEDVAKDATLSNSRGFSINASGFIAGVIVNADGHTFASLWQEGFGWVFAGVDPPGFSPSYAYAINDQNFIVGTYATGANGLMRAFISYYKSLEDRDTADLNTLVDNLGDWTLTRATGINNRGQIVGDGIDPSGNVRAWLLSPT